MDLRPPTPVIPAYVTSEHTAAARGAWEAARDRGAPTAQLAALRSVMEALWSRQADQFRAEFHREHATGHEGGQCAS